MSRNIVVSSLILSWLNQLTKQIEQNPWFFFVPEKKWLHSIINTWSISYHFVEGLLHSVLHSSWFSLHSITWLSDSLTVHVHLYHQSENNKIQITLVYYSFSLIISGLLGHVWTKVLCPINIVILFHSYVLYELNKQVLRHSMPHWTLRSFVVSGSHQTLTSFIPS